MFTRCNPYVITEDSLPTIDFDRVLLVTQLSFSDKSKESIRWLAAKYLAAKEAEETAPSRVIKAKLREADKAAQLLIEILQANRLQEKRNDLLVLRSVAWLLPRHCGLPSHDIVSDYLRHFRMNVRPAISKKAKTGPLRGFALQGFLESLHVFYREAGGSGLGCYVDRVSGESKGDFLEISVALIEQIDPSRAGRENLGKIIRELKT
ncbi:hypothetical protein JCM15519_27490 [Fundidesulfovibrio butyratiphilus]